VRAHIARPDLVEGGVGLRRADARVEAAQQPAELAALQLARAGLSAR
jgi:hypothetical protein